MEMLCEVASSPDSHVRARLGIHLPIQCVLGDVLHSVHSAGPDLNSGSFSPKTGLLEATISSGNALHRCLCKPEPTCHCRLLSLLTAGSLPQNGLSALALSISQNCQFFSIGSNTHGQATILASLHDCRGLPTGHFVPTLIPP